MGLRRLTLTQFRSHTDAAFAFTNEVNVIVGPNGAGKTNILEAIYVITQGHSFRVSDKLLIQHGQNWFRLEAEFDDHARTLSYSTEHGSSKKFSVSGNVKKRMSREARVPIVLFEPDTLRMLTGSPARRRAYLDTLCAQWFHDGASLLRRYERVLAQRNNLLKRAFSLSAAQLDDQLFPWDVSLAEMASVIEERRRFIVERLNASFSHEYNRIAQKNSELEIHYKASHAQSQSAYVRALHEHRQLDISRAHTTIGPHRSDFSVLLNGQPAEHTASRGEQRSIVLALKNIELHELARITGQRSILLLDDVMSELDETRQAQLLHEAIQAQVIITSTSNILPAGAAANIIALA